MPIDNDLWLSCALFGVFVCGISIFTRSSNLRTSLSSESPAFQPLLKGQAYHLACALEDAPANALRGQAYELATPLMTPLACILTHNWHQIYQQQLGKPGIHYLKSWQNAPATTKADASSRRRVPPNV
jgi:hypothetical protein